MLLLRAKTRSLVLQRRDSCRKHCSGPLSKSGVGGICFVHRLEGGRTHTYIHTCISS